MMKRATIAFAAGVAACALSAPVASASLVNRTVEKCTADAEWRVTLDFAGTSYADLSYDTGPTGCKSVDAVVHEDGDFSVGSSDGGRAATIRYNLIGAGVTGVQAFAGVAKYANGPELGPVVIANGTTLSATLVGVAPDGYHSVVEHYGTASCGTNCYRTRAVWESGLHPGP